MNIIFLLTPCSATLLPDRLGAAASQASGAPDVEPLGLFPLLHAQSERQVEILAAQTAIMRSQEHQEALNRRLLSAQFTGEYVSNYALASSNVTLEAVDAAERAMRPYTAGLERAVGSYLISSYLDAASTGASLYNSQLLGKFGIRATDYEPVLGLTESYNGLISVSQRSGLDSSRLQTANEEIASRLRG